MKRAQAIRIALGVLNIVAIVSLVVRYYFGWFLKWGAPDAFTWGLPVLIAAAVALICGIFTLYKKSWRWAVSGLYVVGAAWIYFLILSWIVMWVMA